MENRKDGDPDSRDTIPMDVWGSYFSEGDELGDLDSDDVPLKLKEFLAHRASNAAGVSVYKNKGVGPTVYKYNESRSVTIDGKTNVHTTPSGVVPELGDTSTNDGGTRADAGSRTMSKPSHSSAVGDLISYVKSKGGSHEHGVAFCQTKSELTIWIEIPDIKSSTVKIGFKKRKYCNTNALDISNTLINCFTWDDSLSVPATLTDDEARALNRKFDPCATQESNRNLAPDQSNELILVQSTNKTLIFDKVQTDIVIDTTDVVFHGKLEHFVRVEPVYYTWEKVSEIIDNVSRFFIKLELKKSIDSSEGCLDMAISSINAVPMIVWWSRGFISYYHKFYGMRTWEDVVDVMNIEERVKRRGREKDRGNIINPSDVISMTRSSYG